MLIIINIKSILIPCNTSRPDKHGCVLWYFVKSDMSNLRYSTLNKSLFTRYKKHTAMYNGSPCPICLAFMTFAFEICLSVKAIEDRFRYIFF